MASTDSPRLIRFIYFEQPLIATSFNSLSLWERVGVRVNNRRLSPFTGIHRYQYSDGPKYWPIYLRGGFEVQPETIRPVISCFKAFTG
jgi:hypothetical protein